MSAPTKVTAEGARVGCFQIVLLFLLAVNYLIVSMSHALPVFHSYTPKFYCESTAAGTNRTYGCVNRESFENVSLFARVWGGEENFTSCPIGYTWESENSERSVVVDWSLICERSHLSYLGPTIYYVGVAIGAWVAGLVADRIGRLPVLAICLYTQGTMAVATYIVQSYPAFLVLRGLQGLFAQGLQNSTYILVLELFPKKMRTLAATAMEIGWALGLVILAALSYFIPNWRVLQLAVSVPTALTVLYIWIIPESPRWLLAKGKSTEADIALEKIVKYNACCSGRSRRALVVEADNNANTKPAKPERKSRLIRAVDETRNSTNGESGESTNLLTPPNPVKRKSRGTKQHPSDGGKPGEETLSIEHIEGSSIRAMAENLEKRLSVSNGDTATTELAASREDDSETDVSVEAPTGRHRESRVSSTSGENAKPEESENAETVKIIPTPDRDGKFGESENDEAPTTEKCSTSGPPGEAAETENDDAPAIETSSTSGPICEARRPENDEVSEIKISSTSGRNGKIPTAENEDVPTITKLPEVAAEEPIASRSDEIRDIEQVQEIDTIAACSPRRSRYLTKHLTVMAYQWFTASVTQSVVLGVPTELSGNRHVNFAIGGCFEAIVYVITYFVLTRYGRRLPMSLCQLVTGGICITVGILAVSRSSTVGLIGPTSSVFLLIGRAAIVCSLATAYLFTVEIFPTVIRGACLGLCGVSGIVGSLTAPYILSLKNHTTITVPLTLVGVLSLISGLVCLILPETVNERLPDTAQQMGRKSTRNKIGVAGCDYVRAETEDKPVDREVLREKLFSEDWVDAGNGIIVNFTENKN